MPSFFIHMPRRTRKSNSTHIQQTDRLLIPDDWDEENDGYCHIVLCVPNSVKWRATITGALDRLTYGRLWDASTGNITKTQEIVEEIIASIPMNCNELTRIADTLENLYDAQFVNIDDIIELLPDGILKTLLENLGNLGEALDFLLPGINLSLPQIRILSMITEALNRQKTFNRMDQQTAMLQALVLSINGQSGRQVAENLIEEKLPAQPILDLIDTFIAEQQVGLVDDNILASIKPDWITEKLDDLECNASAGGSSGNGEDDMTTVIVNNNCGCCDDKSTQTTGTSGVPTNVTNPPAINGPINQNPPPGFETWSDYTDYKCGTAHHVFDQMFDFVGFFDTWRGSIALSGIGNVINLVSGLNYYWMTSENLSSFVGNLFNWAIATEAPPTFWNTFQNKLIDWKPTLICLMYESPDTTAAIQTVTDTLEDILDEVLLAFSVATGGPVKALGLSLIANMIPTSLMNDLFQRGDNVPDNSDKTCSCAGSPPANTGVCYSMNTVTGLGQSNLVSDDGSTQVWRVYPEFVSGVYKIDLQAFDQAGAQIAYQITQVDEHSSPGGGHDLIEYNYQDGSQTTSFAAGCVDNIRYESVSPGWSLDVFVDLDEMNGCIGCFTENCDFSFSHDSWGYGSGKGSGSLIPSGQQRVINSEVVGSKHHIKFEINKNATGCDRTNREVVISSTSGYSSASNNTGFMWCSDTNNAVSIVQDNQDPGGTTPPDPGTYEIAGLFWISDTAWSITLSVSDAPPTGPC